MEWIGPLSLSSGPVAWPARRAAAMARRRASSARFRRTSSIRLRSCCRPSSWARSAWRALSASAWASARRSTRFETCCSAAVACASSPCLVSRFCGRRLALGGDLGLGLLDLLLLHGEQGPGGLEPVEDDRLLVDDVLHGVELAGQLRRVLGGEHHREAHQRRVALLVVLHDDLAERLLLGDDLLAAGHQVVPGVLEPGDRRVELGLHLLVENLGGGELAARLGEVRLRGVELAPGRRELGGGVPELGAGLVEGLVGAADLLLDLVLLLLQLPGLLRHRLDGVLLATLVVVRGGHRDGRHPEQQAARQEGREDARPLRAGEGAKHGICLVDSGEEATRR